MYCYIDDQELMLLSKSRSAAVFGVYIAIKQHAFANKTTCFPTRKRLLSLLDGQYSLKTITNAISTLSKLGLIDRKHNTKSNCWYFVLKLKEAALKAFQGSRKEKGPHRKQQAANKRTLNKKTSIKYNRKSIKSEPEKPKPIKSQAQKWIHFALGKVLGLKSEIPNPASNRDSIIMELTNNPTFTEYKDDVVRVLNETDYNEALSIDKAWLLTMGEQEW